MPITVSVGEQQVLTDIFNRTGMRYVRIQAVPTSDQEIARAVLSVLVEWVPRAEREIRAAIYTRFSTKYAAPFLSLMVDWLKGEDYSIAIELLSGALKKVANHSNAPWLLEKVPELPRSPNYYFL